MENVISAKIMCVISHGNVENFAAVYFDIPGNVWGWLPA